MEEERKASSLTNLEGDLGMSDTDAERRNF